MVLQLQQGPSKTRVSSGPYPATRQMKCLHLLHLGSFSALTSAVPIKIGPTVCVPFMAYVLSLSCDQLPQRVVHKTAQIVQTHLTNPDQIIRELPTPKEQVKSCGANGKAIDISLLKNPDKLQRELEGPEKNFMFFTWSEEEFRVEFVPMDSQNDPVLFTVRRVKEMSLLEACDMVSGILVPNHSEPHNSQEVQELVSRLSDEAKVVIRTLVHENVLAHLGCGAFKVTFSTVNGTTLKELRVNRTNSLCVAGEQRQGES